MGGAGSLPDEEIARNITIAGITRASTAVDEDLALKCWQENRCETGTGGEIVVGLADGFGGNVARQLFEMEFILKTTQGAFPRADVPPMNSDAPRPAPPRGRTTP